MIKLWDVYARGEVYVRASEVVEVREVTRYDGGAQSQVRLSDGRWISASESVSAVLRLVSAEDSK